VFAILMAGASFGIAITAGMPSSCAACATPWAWLPEENATTPLARASVGTRLHAL